MKIQENDAQSAIMLGLSMVIAAEKGDVSQIDLLDSSYGADEMYYSLMLTIKYLGSKLALREGILFEEFVTRERAELSEI